MSIADAPAKGHPIEGDMDGGRAGLALLARHRPDTLVAFGESGERDAADLLAAAARIADALPEASPGSHVQVVFERDRYALAATLLGALARGHAVALPPNGRPESILALQAREDVVTVAHDLDAGLGLDVRPLLDPAGAQDPATTHPTHFALDADRVIATVHTSGSTGPMTPWPKTAAQLVGEAASLARSFDLGPGTRVLPTVSPGHIYGLLFGVLVPLVSGGAFARDTPHHPESIARAAERFAATVLVSVPVQLRALARAEGVRLPRFRRVFSSTGPLADADASRFVARHGLAIDEILGSTETGGFAHRRRADAPAGPWTPFSGVAVEVDAEGRLCVDSPFVDVDCPRPFVTGDLAEMQPDGRFVHRGRADGIVKVAGHRVSLQAVEAHLREQPEIDDAAVVAIPDDRGRGHRLVAALAPRDLDAERIRGLLLERLEPSCLPRPIRRFDTLPREENGKLQRRALLQLFDLDEHGRARRFALDWQPARVSRDDETTTWRSGVRIPEDYAYYDGHFDGYPVLAGAVQIKELVMPALVRAFPELGPIERMTRVRWPERIVPGDALEVVLERRDKDESVRFRIERDGIACASGTLRLREAKRAERDATLGPASADCRSERAVEDRTPRVCGLVPTYDNPLTLRGVVERMRRDLPEVVVIDDGSAEPGRRVAEALAREGLAHVVRVGRNRGKGAAVRRGLAVARSLGFSHAFQVDADGQHDLASIPTFLDAAQATPEAVVAAHPVYDETAPALRRAARRITQFWVEVETGSRDRIVDGMIGFRIYPIEASLAVDATSDRMAYDVEVLVRLARAEVPIVNLPVRVRYLAPEEGGLSHFAPVMDNVRMFWMHSRLCTEGATRWCLERLGRLVGLGRG